MKPSLHALLLQRAGMLRAMAHPARLCIMRGLLDNERCNVSGMQNCLGLPQSTISQHLAKLRAAGLVISERRGLRVLYSVDSGVRRLVLSVLSDVPPVESWGCES